MDFFPFLGQPFQLCLEDLSKDVIRKLNARLAGDQVASRHIYESFQLFPDTPVKLFKDVLEALQLYDLVELLEKPQKPPPVKTLRPALPLQEIEKLKKSTDPRPTTYHSSVAVLIITDKKNHRTEGFERFFKGFSSKSDVVVFEWKTQAYEEFQSPLDRFQSNDQEVRKEMETNAAAVSAVIERWIHNKGW